MSAVFVRPLAFTVLSATSGGSGTPQDLNVDHPGLAWRAPTSAGLVLDLGQGAQWDFVALVGTNLQPNSIVRIQSGGSASGTGSYDSGSVAAYAGIKPPVGTVMSINRTNSVRSDRYVRVDWNGVGVTDGFVNVQRIVVGKMITTEGLEYDAAQSFIDRSVLIEGPGYRSTQRHDVLAQWKFQTVVETGASWRGEWNPFLRWAGNSRCVLMIPFDEAPANWTTDAIFGCITNQASGKIPAHDRFVVDLVITSNSE